MSQKLSLDDGDDVVYHIDSIFQAIHKTKHFGLQRKHTRNPNLHSAQNATTFIMVFFVCVQSIYCDKPIALLHLVHG